ncbi:MarR family winged helix-turn-helix transcriptional regulator [Nitrospira sp. M1]
MSAPEVHDILERLCNLLRMEMRTYGLKFGLQPVQIEALTYLTQCNRYSDTPQAVTEYLGLTKGTVSQSLKVLEQKGLLRKQQDRQDKRMVHLTPTTKGKKFIEQSIPAKGLETALETAHSFNLHELKEVLRGILRGMQRTNKRKTFAACHTCRFNEQHQGGYVCGLTREPLSKQEIQLICREHQFPELEQTNGA